MRLLHTADWHLGRSFESWSLIEHQEQFLRWLADVCIERSVDAVLVSGDVYDRAVPPLDAIHVLENALGSLVATCPVILIPGNHDSPTRLGFGGQLLDAARVHLRATLADIVRPVALSDAQGTRLLVYGIPFLEPLAVRDQLGCERTHASALAAAMELIRADVRRQPSDSSGLPPRVVVLAHGVVGGGARSDSERDISIGGVAEAPASTFDGCDYVALGHLHRPQWIESAAAGPLIHYSGSPLAYSFSEEQHTKSVTLIDLAPTGPLTVEQIAVPVPRRLITLTGTLQQLCTDPALDGHADDWVRAIVTDPVRPERIMDRLRERFGFIVAMAWQPPAATGPTPLDGRPEDVSADPVEVVRAFIEHVTATAASARMLELVDEAVQRIRLAERDR
ncbi:MAG: exonuclease SbcCD subunit D [Actinomycetales bacterium]|nr:exonuclease SbcCD subunit D [Actinomycetales bacterium]